jgi:hypothetical protein
MLLEKPALFGGWKKSFYDLGRFRAAHQKPHSQPEQNFSRYEGNDLNQSEVHIFSLDDEDRDATSMAENGTGGKAQISPVVATATARGRF